MIHKTSPEALLRMQNKHHEVRASRRPTTFQRVLLTTLLCFWGTAAMAQNPNFAGSWTADLERSDAVMPNGQKLENSYQLTFSGDDLDVTRTFTVEGQSNSLSWQLVTDGKAQELPGWRGPRMVRAKWKKEKLNLSYTMTTPTPRGSFDLDVTEQWRLNKNGELEIIYVTRMPQRSVTRTEIYVKDTAK